MLIALYIRSLCGASKVRAQTHFTLYIRERAGLDFPAEPLPELASRPTPSPRVLLKVPKVLLGRELGHELSGVTEPAVGAVTRLLIGKPVTASPGTERVDHAVEPLGVHIEVPAPAFLPGEGWGRGWTRRVLVRHGVGGAQSEGWRR
jgi:hypothetical protein